MLEACTQLGITFVAFSPLARAYLTGLKDPSTLDAKDIRRTMPRFKPEHYPHNLALLTPFEQLAQQLSCTPAQLALAWVLNKAPQAIVIPGTTEPAHMKDNFSAQTIKLSPVHLNQLDALFAPSAVSGQRYDPQSQSEVDTEMFAN